MISNVLADIRYAARTVLNHIGYAGIVMLTLALGIGVTVAVFSLTEQILLRPLPVTEPGNLVNLSDPGPKSVGMISFPLAATRPSVSGDLLPAVRETVARVDPTRPIANLHTVEQQLRASIATERFLAGASTAFAVLATALAALGLYGVLAYSVAQRAREIGLRVALGAPVARIRRMVLRQTAGIAVVGIVLGAIAASMLGRAARSLLFGVEGSDPLAFAAAAAVLTAVMLGATHVPARRAARVDPMKVLRYE